jgi:hypothetical protein
MRDVDHYRARAVTFWGYLATETLHLSDGSGDTTIEDFEFLEADRTGPTNTFSFYTLFDGVLGLAPFDISNPLTGIPSFLKALAMQHKLQRGMFAILLSSNVYGTGELAIGELPTEARDLVGTFPLSETSIEHGMWNIDVEGLTWDGEFTSVNTTASILTSDQRIGLPRWLAIGINERITIGQNNIEVDCSKRGEFPTLQFHIQGEYLVLDGFDYTVESVGPEGSHCVTNIYWSDGIMAPYHPEFAIGYGAFRRYVTVYDLYDREIRRKSLESSCLPCRFNINWL